MGHSFILNMAVLICVFAFSLVVSSAEIISSSSSKSELYGFQHRVQTLQAQLEKECPHLLSADPFRGRRAIIGSSTDASYYFHSLMAEKTLFVHYLQLLADCQRGKTTVTTAPATTTPTTTTPTTTTPTTTTPTTTTPTTTTPTTTTPTPTTPTTTTPTTTTGVPLPSQCTSPSTKNLTESWRNNYLKTDLLHDDIKFLNDQTWFRFTGDAGSQLKNTCPTQNSCGSSGAYWSDDVMPTQVGTTTSINFYESYSPDRIKSCKRLSITGKVTRCSDAGDFVYLLVGSGMTDDDTMCGMN